MYCYLSEKGKENMRFTVLNEDITDKQLRNAANRRLANPNSVKIGRSSTGELTTTKMNSNSKYKKSLSRLVVKKFSEGGFKPPIIRNANQDTCIKMYNDVKKKLLSDGNIVFRGVDSTLGRKVCYGISTGKPLITQIYVETDDLTAVKPIFDTEPPKRIMAKNGMDTSFFKFADEPEEKKRKRNRFVRVRDNWGWIDSNNTRPWVKRDMTNENIIRRILREEIEKHFQTYGLGKYNPISFQPVQNRVDGMMMNKPKGGLWASPVKDNGHGWKEWNESEKFMAWDDDDFFEFRLKPNARVLEIRTEQDAMNLPRIEDNPKYENFFGRRPWYREDYRVHPDFEELSKKYDVIDFECNSDTYEVMFGWDVDSILVMNPEVIEIISDSKHEKPTKRHL